jgi:hypothetical protein
VILKPALSETPSARQPHGVGIVHVRNIDDLVLEPGIEMIEQHHPDPGAVDEIFIAVALDLDSAQSRAAPTGAADS